MGRDGGLCPRERNKREEREGREDKGKKRRGNRIRGEKRGEKKEWVLCFTWYFSI